MKRILSLFCMMAASFAEGQTLAAPESARLSPAEQNIADARKSITGNPQQYQGYNALAAALVRRAQETSNASFYAQAEAAIKNSLQMAPDTEQESARRCDGVRLVDRCQHGTRELQGCRGDGTVDAQPSPRKSSCAYS